MITLSKPQPCDVSEFLRSCEDAPFTYDHIGATRYADEMPSGFHHDESTRFLGRGQNVFAAGTQALRQWQMFPSEMTTVLTPASAIDVGQVVAIRFKSPIAWCVCACRIVYTIDERESETARFGFAYGTLPGHVECGEERFLVEWDRASDDVWYSILAFSKPQHPLVKFAQPYARYQQARFRRLSGESMVRAIRQQLR